MTAANCVP